MTLDKSFPRKELFDSMPPHCCSPPIFAANGDEPGSQYRRYPSPVTLPVIHALSKMGGQLAQCVQPADGGQESEVAASILRAQLHAGVEVLQRLLKFLGGECAIAKLLSLNSPALPAH